MASTLNTGNWSTVSSATRNPKPPATNNFGLAKPSPLDFANQSSGIVKTNHDWAGPTRIPELNVKPDNNQWGQGIGYTVQQKPPYTVVPSPKPQQSSGVPQMGGGGGQFGGGGMPQFGGGQSYGGGGGGGGMPAGGWDMGQFASQLAGILGGNQQKEPEKPKTQAQLHPNGTPSGANYKDPRMQSPSWIGGANLFDDKTHGANFTSQLAARQPPAAPAPTTPTAPKPTTPKPTTPAKPAKPTKPSWPGHGHGVSRSPLARLAAARGRWW